MRKNLFTQNLEWALFSAINYENCHQNSFKLRTSYRSNPIHFCLRSVFCFRKNREDEFNDRLGYKITWRSEFLFDLKLSDSKIKELHERNKKLLNEADISVYDSNKKLIFTDIQPSSENKHYLDQLIRSQKEKITWQKKGRQYMAVKYPFHDIS